MYTVVYAALLSLLLRCNMYRYKAVPGTSNGFLIRDSRIFEAYSVAVTSRKGKAIHTIYGIIRTDMVKTRVEPPAQNNVPKTIYEYIIHRQQSSMP